MLTFFKWRFWYAIPLSLSLKSFSKISDILKLAEEEASVSVTSLSVSCKMRPSIHKRIKIKLPTFLSTPQNTPQLKSLKKHIVIFGNIHPTDLWSSADTRKYFLQLQKLHQQKIQIWPTKLWYCCWGANNRWIKKIDTRRRNYFLWLNQRHTFYHLFIQ